MSPSGTPSLPGHHGSLSPTPPAAAARLAPISVAVAATAVVAGIVTGGVTYLNRSSAPVHNTLGTSAWSAHIALTVAAAMWLVVAYQRRRRHGRVGVPLLLTPLGAPAAHRLALTSRTAPARALAAAPLIALLMYNTWRVGRQIVGGLDPHFTADAWGGPTYFGAMYCHYLDVGLISTAAALLIDRILLKPR